MSSFERSSKVYECYVPKPSAAHSPLIAVVVEFWWKEWQGCGHSCLGFVWANKGISGHVNNFEEGYKRSSYELGTIENAMAAKLTVIQFVQESLRSHSHRQKWLTCLYHYFPRRRTSVVFTRNHIALYCSLHLLD